MYSTFNNRHKQLYRNLYVCSVRSLMSKPETTVSRKPDLMKQTARVKSEPILFGVTLDSEIVMDSNHQTYTCIDTSETYCV